MTTTPMSSLAHDHESPKPSKAELAQQALAELMVTASTRKFYGTLTLTLVVQDGRIQYLRTTRDETIR